MPTTADAYLPFSAAITEQPRSTPQDGRRSRAPSPCRRSPSGREAEHQRAAPMHGRDDHRVDRAAALLGPVDVLEVEPERELVQGQARPRPRRRRPGSRATGCSGWSANSQEPGEHHRARSRRRGDGREGRRSVSMLPGHHGTLGLRISRVLMRMNPNESRNPASSRTPASWPPPSAKLDLNGDFGRRRHADILTPRWP